MIFAAKCNFSNPQVHAFLLENVFSKEECNDYIKETEKAGYDSLISEYPAEYRSNDRLLTIAPTEAS